MNFNETTAGPKYTYRPNPHYERSFMIMRKSADAPEFAPFGEYTVLDLEEDHGLTEKKVMNLVAALNGKKNLIELGHETKARTYFHVRETTDEEGRSKVLFSVNDGKGVSKENAIFTFEGDINDER